VSSGTHDERALEDLLFDLRDLIETARTMPMSASVLVNRDEALAVVEAALASFPEELRQARWLLKERDEFLEEARRDADAIIEAARTQATRMVERTEIAREARRSAEQTTAAAEADARRLRHEAEDFVDARLARFEDMLAKTLAAVRHGRDRLQPDLAVMTDAPVDDDDEAFYDQDGLDDAGLDRGGVDRGAGGRG
jgi:F0F1-type ATP synthase membrane subunit b/b'